MYAPSQLSFLISRSSFLDAHFPCLMRFTATHLDLQQGQKPRKISETGPESFSVLSKKSGGVMSRDEGRSPESLETFKRRRRILERVCGSR